MKNPKRVETFAERQKIKGETAEIGEHYVCGCGNFLWILLKNGDCVCGQCLRAQARIIVNELAPVGPPLGEQKEADNGSQESS